jgi:protein-tyrosine phosphatase
MPYFAAMSLPTLERVTNFRELGGLPTSTGRRVKAGFVFRSGHWGRASDEDVEHLGKLGVGLVVDFRSEKDCAHEGEDRLPTGCQQLSLAASDPAGATDTRELIMSGDIETLREHFGGDRADAFMERGARRLVLDHTEVYAAFLSRLAEPECPRALFHCSAGKDRAGWAASSLLLALGVPVEHVSEHYLVSNRTYDTNKQHGILPQMDIEIVELLQPIMGVKADYLQASIDAACERWGSLDGYYREGLSLSETQLEQLRENWTEDAPA